MYKFNSTYQCNIYRSASESTEVAPPGAGFAPAPAAIQQPTVIQAPQDSLIGDLLSMDLGPPQPQVAPMPGAMGGSTGMDLLAGGLDELVTIVVVVPCLV